MNWLTFALMTVASWGVYGIFLHNGQTAMLDKSNALYKSFLFVGVAYFLTAVLAPLAILVVRKANWTFPGPGMGWSLVAGIVGALGAFCVLLAFAAGGRPPVVMSIVFAGAPVVNAGAFMLTLMVHLGGFLVTKFKPAAPVHKAPAASASAPSIAGRH